MCRYAMVTYKPHYACFNCQKTFKRKLMNDINRGEKSHFEAKCPQCGALTASMGLDFESPKKKDSKAWENIKRLYSVGIAFHSCGCSGPGYIPNTKEELILYFENIKDKYLKNTEFWRNRTEPEGKAEREKDIQKNWYELGRVSPDFKKEVVKNQDGIKYWLDRVKEVEEKLATIK